jgi:hypothetical protein
MTIQDRLQLMADRKFLQERLAAVPDHAQMMRISTEARLQTIEEELQRCAVDAPARVRLTFNGRPIIGSHGIFAEFGMKAVTSFTEAVSAIAASLSAPLAAMGPIPNREQHQLLITNTALGSFGFELEEHCDGAHVLQAASPVARALEGFQALLEGTLGTDDQLADSVAETDPRAMEKVRAFIQVLSENDAFCSLQCRERTFRFTDTGQVRLSLARLSYDNLHEEEKTLEGGFLGILPKAKTFEFELTDQSEVIRGKLGPAIQDPDAINKRLYQKTKIKVMVTVVGKGRPRYLLLDGPQWAP